MNNQTDLILHHVGYATKELAPSVEQYVSRFGYRIATPALHDPLQTAIVQFLQLPRDTIYLEFVAPDGPESRLSRFTRKYSGLHHLCYSVTRLDTAVENLQQGSMMLVSEPQPAVAFGGRRICWLVGEDLLPIELVERMGSDDLCIPVGGGDPE